MFDIWKNVKDLVHVSERKVYITNPVFVLHSKVTVAILLAFSILVTSRQYLGEPINCISSNDVKAIADKYCWIHSTFTRASLISDKTWGYEATEEVPELPPGIRPEIEDDTPRIYHTYYQWVWLVLFLQAGLFYVPYWLWKMWDRGRIKLLVSDLNLEVIMADDKKMVKQKEAILEYLTPNAGHHTKYAIQFIFCEILNTANVVIQIFLTDIFLNYTFSKYGIELFSLSQKQPYQRSDHLARVFPIVTACRIATGGVAFGTMEYDLLCVLNINILNEKIYIFLWFWFISLAALSVLNLVYRILVILIPPLRKVLLRRRVGNHYTLSSSVDKLDCSYGDWFLLNKLGENLNPVVFAEILQELHDDMMSNPSTLISIKQKMEEEMESNGDIDESKPLNSTANLGPRLNLAKNTYRSKSLKK